MIEIDKSDKLYKYLSNLGAENVDELYVELAQLGRYNLKDVKTYFQSTFQPSSTNDISEDDLEQVVDYFTDLKKIKPLSQKQIKQALKLFKQTKDNSIKEQIINSKLKDCLYLCLNYKTLHNNINIQDLVQTASLGLIDAIDKYNEDAKIEFDDYILFWIRQRITKEIKEN